MASNGSGRGKLLTAGGILSILAGILQTISGLLAVVAVLFPDIVRCAPILWVYILLIFFPYAWLYAFMSDLLSAEIVIFPICGVVLGILAVVGGISAIRRKRFGLSLAGAICALLSHILGILAVIFVALGKREFGAKVKEDGI